jgi:hypothetical protein
MLILAGFVGLFSTTTRGKKLSVVAIGTSLLIVPYLLTQFFLFHAENRYGLPVMAFLYMFSTIGLKRIMGSDSSSNYGRMLYVLSVVIWVTISWSLYVKPFV